MQYIKTHEHKKRIIPIEDWSDGEEYASNAYFQLPAYLKWKPRFYDLIVKDTWLLSECIHALHGLDCAQYEMLMKYKVESDKYFDSKEGLDSQFIAFIEHSASDILRAIVNSLERVFIDFSNSYVSRNSLIVGDWNGWKTAINRLAFIRWGLEKGYKFPCELIPLIEDVAELDQHTPLPTDTGQGGSVVGGGDKPTRYKVDRKNTEKHRLTRETAERILKKKPNITQKELRVEARKGTGRGSFTQYICDDVWKDHKAKRKIERQT